MREAAHDPDVEGPVRAEIFVVWLNEHDLVLELTGPCGAAPWYVELEPTDHPVTVVERVVRGALGSPKLIHSTSWRRDRDAVILSFVVVIDATDVGAMDSVAIGRAALARSAAPAAPTAIGSAHVVEKRLPHHARMAPTG